MTDWTKQARAAEDLTPRIVQSENRLFFEFATARRAEGIDFPWWDRPTDLIAFTDWLRRDDVPDFFDADQGWTFDAARRADRLYFRQGDLDTGEVFITLSVDRTDFMARFEAVLAVSLGEQLDRDLRPSSGA
ncbi:MAG: hypothetical protein Q7J26_10295 [Brevundimonas sp.]|uniref:hypothetical protein n=1 Tax=Brevundimonas sp. TaxID=1871086 RepID=UPI0027293758|nr:hypothetical protein [Brevundimonas sp.]MDO9608903.1 hypothetical protein [Brevundimonas sp.]